jgi:4,5-dihydroxyphthalate decarboxylase
MDQSRSQLKKDNMSKLNLSIACGPYDRFLPMLSGEVQVTGCKANCMAIGPEELFFRVWTNAEFDVCEMSLSSYLVSVDSGKSQYIAIPVFPSRVFRHSAIYVRNDRGIESPQDLKGRVVGVPEYQMTAALWARGILDDEYNVAPSDLVWRTGGLHEPDRKEKSPLSLPDTIRIAPIEPGETLNGMLQRGQIDALISARPPSCFQKGDVNVRRLFPDHGRESRAYFSRTGLYPIMHVVGVRRSLVAEHPWLANSLYDAFGRSKDISLERLRDCGAFSVGLPFLDANLEDAAELMGDDVWPYGIDKNRHTLEKTFEYAHRHGTTQRRLTMAEVFAESTLVRFKV